MKNFWIILFGLLWMLVSCAPKAVVGISPVETGASPIFTFAPAMESATAPSKPDTVNPTTEIPAPIIINDEMDAILEQAKKMLAQKLGIGVEDIILFDIQAVDWNDASLGCPQPDMVYAQVITPGYQIVLEANGKVFTFHADEIDRVILCDVRAPNEIFLPP